MTEKDQITITIDAAPNQKERRQIRLEHKREGKTLAIYEQTFPVNDDNVSRADALALRRFAQILRGL